MTQQNFPYLLAEDAAFCRGYRLSEDEFLEMLGGVAGYTQHRLDRDRGRGAGFQIPKLNSNLEDALPNLKATKLSEKQWAHHLVSEQRQKVAGVIGTIRMHRKFSEERTRHVQELASEREATLAKLRQQAANRYGWKSDSQSAIDWAEAEYERRQKGIRAT